MSFFAAVSAECDRALGEMRLPNAGNGLRHFRSGVARFAADIGLRLGPLVVALPAQTGIAAQTLRFNDQIQHLPINFLHLLRPFNVRRSFNAGGPAGQNANQDVAPC